MGGFHGVFFFSTFFLFSVLSKVITPASVLGESCTLA